MANDSNTKHGQVLPRNFNAGSFFRRTSKIPIALGILALLICAALAFWLRPLTRPGDDDVVAISFSSDGKELLGGTRRGEALLWSGTGAATPSFRPSQTHFESYLPAPFNSLTMNPTGHYAAVAGSSLFLISLVPGGSPPKLSAPPGAYGGAAFSVDGRLLAAANSSERLFLWNLADSTRQPVDLGPADAGVYGAVAFSADATRLVFVGHTVRLIDLQTGQDLWTRPRDNYTFLCVAFSPDGTRIAAGSQDTTVYVWDALTGTPLMRLHGHSGYVEALAFSPDGRTIASYGGKELYLWNVSTGAGAALGKATGGVAFGPDGRWVASGGPHRTIFLWKTSPDHKKEILAWEPATRSQAEKR